MPAFSSSMDRSAARALTLLVLPFAVTDKRSRAHLPCAKVRADAVAMITVTVSG